MIGLGGDATARSYILIHTNFVRKLTIFKNHFKSNLYLFKNNTRVKSFKFGIYLSEKITYNEQKKLTNTQSTSPSSHHTSRNCGMHKNMATHIRETNGQIIPVPVELHTTVDLPCKCPICPESMVAVQWYRSSDSDIYLKDEEAIAWWYEGDTGSSPGFGIKDDFSMIMYDVNLNTEGVYRCIASSLGVAAKCTHDAKLIVYANPDRSPVIEYIQQDNGFNVTCSISKVFPMTFPILTTKEGERTASNNIDGTFNTTVTQWFPANKNDTTIECLYSNFNFKSIASLHIVGSDTIDQNTTDDTDNTDCRPKPSGLWMVWILLIKDVIFFIFIVIVIIITTRRVLRNRAQGRTTQNSKDDGGQDEHIGENSKVEEPAKSTRVMLLSKRTCTVILLTVNTIVLIILVAYLSTAKCSYEPDVKLEGNVPTE